MKLRTVEACGKHVRKADPYARYFFFREEGNYHCAACPLTYKGHPTTGTGHQNSRIYTYKILNWKEPVFPWSKWYRKQVKGRYCYGHRENSYVHKTVLACGKWVQKVDDEARYFMYNGRHCSSCPPTYTGHPTTGTRPSAKFEIFYIKNWRQPGWMKKFKRSSINRVCSGYTHSKTGLKNITECAAHVRKSAPFARFFFFRHNSNHHCGACPKSYRGHPTTGTVVKNSGYSTYGYYNWRQPTFSWSKKYQVKYTNRYCTGYKKTATNHRTVEACANWVRQVDREAEYFFFRMQSNWHCSPCPMRYKGTTAGTRVDNRTTIMIFRIYGWRAPTYGWSKDYKRIASFRYCSGYKKTATNHRTVEACANWVRKVDDEAKYFFFRHQSNWHCSPCPQSYTGHPTRGTAVDNNTRIFIYRIIGWKPPSWMRDYKRVAMNRYCTGYKKSAFNHRSLTACANWVRKTDREARYFFFRHEGNYHCSPCPQSYTGHPTTGTGHQNSRIYIYRITGWTKPTYSW